MAEKPPKEGSYVHVELISSDPAKTKQFFRDVFGWRFTDVPAMNYSLYEAPMPPHGGLMAPPENVPPGVLNYLWTREIDIALSKIEAAGGAVLQPKMEIQGIGWWAMFREPGGAVLALLQETPRPEPVRQRKSAKPRKAAKKAKSRRARK